MSQILRILNIEDSLVDSEVLHQNLNRLGFSLLWQRVENAQDFVEQLKNQNWNLIISDFTTTDLSAEEALSILRKQSIDIPFILVTGRIGEESVADMMNAGVEDIVLKSRLERLLPVVKRILREHETKAKEAKAQRAANEALAAKEQMIAIVSHDIKNPLSAIQLEAQMLLRAAERSPKSILAEEVKIQSNRILKTTDRLKVLISDLLDKNKTESSLSFLSKTEVDLKKLLFEVLDGARPLIQQKNIEVKVNCTQQLSMIAVDKNKIYQVLCNLLNNAIKFTPDGGIIQLSWEEKEFEFVFTCLDSGPGMSGPELSRVFEKYWTGRTKSSETGLGLFICKTIVEAHGGHIKAENLSHKGALFSFTIPKTTLSSEQLTSFIIGKSLNDLRKRVLVIDDDEDLREVICWALGHEGFSVEAYSSPQDALRKLEKGHHFPHLILIDYHMEGMKGGEFLSLKMDIPIPEVQNCPVIMISASPMDVAQSVAPHLYKEVITKPIDLEGLVKNIMKYLN